MLLKAIPISTRQKHPQETPNPQTNIATKQGLSWQTWHHRFGHIGYSGLQQMLDENLVNGFDVDCESIKPDCRACTEAKQTINPFPKESSSRKVEPGAITHTDLWGPCPTVSINGYSY